MKSAPPALDPIVAPFADPERPLAEREAELAELGRAGDAKSVKTLIAVADSRTYLNWAAVRALGTIGDANPEAGRAARYLEGALGHSDSRMACEVIRALAVLHGENSVPELAAALSQNRERPDGHGEMVCTAAAEALGRLAAPAAVPALAAELARCGEKGWSLEYGSAVVAALGGIRTPEAVAALSAYADRLSALRPEEPLAQEHFDEKIAEARKAAAKAE